jgi:hypothetical protein
MWPYSHAISFPFVLFEKLMKRAPLDFLFFLRGMAYFLFKSGGCELWMERDASVRVRVLKRKGSINEKGVNYGWKEALGYGSREMDQ